MNLSDMLSDNSQNNDDSLLKVLEKRQRYLVSKLPVFFKYTVLLSVLGFLITSTIQFFTNDFSLEKTGLISLYQPTLGAIITIILNLFAVIIMWVFVVWSLVFVPYITYYAYKSSKEDNIPIGGKAFRWVQLYAATFLPMAIFAIAWSSYSIENSELTLKVSTLNDIIVVLVGSGLVSGFIFVASKYIPSKMVAVHLAIFSTLLYITIFLTFGGGYGIYSYSMIFGTLIYLTIGSQKLEELGRRVATYDLDPRIADKLNEIAIKNQEIISASDEIRAKEVELQMKSELHSHNIRSDRMDNDISMAEQLSNINREKIEFNKLSNETLLNVFQQRASLIHNMYEVLASELSDRMSEEIPNQIRELQDNARNYTPDELQEKMKELMGHMNSSLEALPESMKQLQKEMLTAAKDIEKQTYLMHNSSNDLTDAINSGVIVEVYAERDFGFISTANDEKYFFSFTDVQSSGSSIEELLTVGTSVSFLVEEKPNQYNNNKGIAKRISKES
jgi:cold shock CspA family protein